MSWKDIFKKKKEPDADLERRLVELVAQLSAGNWEERVAACRAIFMKYVCQLTRPMLVSSDTAVRARGAESSIRGAPHLLDGRPVRDEKH